MPELAARREGRKAARNGRVPAQASGNLAGRAGACLVGGVNSPVRSFRGAGQPPLFLRSGRGAVVTSVDGRRFVDFILGWGALILGHAHPRVVHAIRAQLTRGVHVGLSHPLEVALAERLVDALPSVDQVRFTTSGTEACMTAIRLARAATGRPKILMFSGCYHGHSDSVLLRGDGGARRPGAGVLSSTAEATVVVPYNDRAALAAALEEHGRQLACAIVEPVAANMGVVVPEPEFLPALRRGTQERGILLICDEVVTGFRLGWGGAQGWSGISPDLTVLGKIIGGGLPIGAVGGRRALMAELAPEGPVTHAGTFAGHTLTMAAGLSTLEVLKREPPYEQLDAVGRSLAQGLREAGASRGAAVQVNQLGSMLTVFFTQGPVRTWADAGRANRDQFATVATHLLQQGFLVPPAPLEAWFLSAVHTRTMAHRLVDAFAKALQRLP